MRTLKLIFPALFACAIGSASAQAGGSLAQSKYDDFFFFGDSLTDTGNLASLSPVGLGSGYPGTSATNGITWTKYLDPNVTTITALSASMIPTAGSVDFSFVLASTGGTSTLPSLITQTDLFTAAQPLVELDSNDLAFVWGGANDFLATDLTLTGETLKNELVRIAGEGSTNIISAVQNLANNGLKNVAVLKTPNIGTSPRLNPIPGVPEYTGKATAIFNARLESGLLPFSQNINVMMIDVDAFLTDAIANKAAYGLTNVEDAAAPNAVSGTPSTLTEAELAEYLFYDDIHPTTTTHQQLARFVAAHLSLESDAQDLNLLTDAALALDDRFGFETGDLASGEVRFNISASNYENKSGLRHRHTQGFRADLDFGISDQMAVGAEIIYATGETGNSELDSLAIGLDGTLSGKIDDLHWELGGGGGVVTGDLDRTYNIGTMVASDKHLAAVFSVHGAIQKKNLTIFGKSAYWELGLKERIIYRNDALETGAASLSLNYGSDTLATTQANFELGIELTEKLLLEIALNPLLFSSGGEINASQANGLGAFSTLDATGFDVHSARAGLRAILNESTVLSANVIAGDDSTWGASIGLSIGL